MTGLPEPPAIEIRELCARYDRTPVLHGITLTVRAGETLGLMGLSGAGKTTLLKAILMLVAPCAGTVRLFGDAQDAPGSRARLAYLPQRFRPPGHLTGQDFLRLSLAFHQLKARRSAAALLAAELGLDPQALRRPIRDYTKSMAQKLGLLATLLTDRPLLLLDEPLSGLDPKARLRLKRQLGAYRARGRTIVMSAQILADHDGLCDRVAVLHQGRLGFVGSAAELQQRHGAATLETAFRAEIERPPALCPTAL